MNRIEKIDTLSKKRLVGDQRCDCHPFSIDRLLAPVKASKL